MSDEKNVDTSGGGSIEGNVSADSFSGRDHIENKPTVNVYNTPPEPRTRRTVRKPGKLMPDEAAELRQALDRLTDKMSQSNVAITELKGTVNQNNLLTMRSINAFEDQLAIVKAQILARAPVWIAYASVTLLALIAVVGTIVSVVWIFQVLRQ